MKRKVMTVFGTRPEAIKMAPVISKLIEHGFETLVAVTGQHREMLRSVLATFSVKSDFDLDIMEEGQTPSSVTRKVLEGIGLIYQSTRPDVVLVHGDTTTTLASALEAFYRQIPIGHVEAGLRTRDIYAPFPEEANRRLVDALASVMYAPTTVSRDNLSKEGHEHSKIVVTGNTIIDAVLEISSREVTLPKQISQFLGSRPGPLVLMTAHRRENFGAPLRAIFGAVKTLVQNNKELKLIYPVHPNPNVKTPAYDLLADEDRILLTEPLEYTGFVKLMSLSRFMMSDSGGIQEEACALGKPVIVMREKTERPEFVESGLGFLSGSKKEKIIEIASKLLSDEDYYSKISRKSDIFGDGHASEKIAMDLKSRFLNGF
jgi:UDP-N-acetylglucosamine 2-epimerase